MSTTTWHEVSEDETEAFRGRLDDALFSDSPTTAPARRVLIGEALIPSESAFALPTAADRSIWAVEGSSDRNAIDRILRIAAEERGTDWVSPRASAAARVHADGDRTGWEDVAFERQRRLSRATVAAAVTLGDAELAEVLDGTWLLCEQSSWCWPAHDDAFAAQGRVLPDVTAPFLDLGAGEVVAQLAWIDHLLGHELEERFPGLRARVRHEARVRVFEPFLARRDWHWLGLDGDVHNWNPWIHGNVLVAALRLLDGPTEADTRAEIVDLCIQGLDRYVSVLPEDGAIDEGYAYWWNGACRALEALEVLRHATGGTLDGFSVPALRATVAFPHRMHLGGPWYLNLADGQARPPVEQPWHALHRAARAVGDAEAAAHAAAHRRRGHPAATETEGLGRLLRGITDPAWVDADAGSSPLPHHVWLPSTQVLLARSTAGTSAGLTLAVKGGHNGEHHNHNDVGSFVVASDGVPVLVDAGRPTYTLQTFGPDRYDIWTMQSGWHNAPTLDGHDQLPGPDYAAADVNVSLTDEVEFSAEIAEAYPATSIRSWRRTARLDRTAKRIEIVDAWVRDGVGDGADEPVESRAPTEVRLIIAGEVSLVDDGAYVHPLDGATPVRLTWPAGLEVSQEIRRLDDPLLRDVWGPRLTRLSLDVTSHTGLRVAVELHPNDGMDGR